MKGNKVVTHMGTLYCAIFTLHFYMIWHDDYDSSVGTFFKGWHQVSYIILVSSLFTVLINYLCILHIEHNS